MRGRPLRIAAAGLCMALAALGIAGFSQLRVESLRLAARSNRTAARPARSIASGPAVQPQPPVTRPAPLVPDPFQGPLAPPPPSKIAPQLAATAAPEPPPFGPRQQNGSPDDDRWAADEPPTARPSPTYTAAVVSQSRRRKEFVELPAPPEFTAKFDTDSLQTDERWLDHRGDDSVLAELASLRRELDGFRDEQRQRASQELENQRRRDAEKQTDRVLAGLQESVFQLRMEQAARIVMSEPSVSGSATSTGLRAPCSNDIPKSTTDNAPSNSRFNGRNAAIDGSASPFAESRLASASAAVSITQAQEAGTFDFEFRAAAIDAVLSGIGEAGGWNIVVSPDVTANVTAAWKGVTPQQALDALLAAHHLTGNRQAAFLMVTRAQSAAALESERPTLVQLYRPLYVSSRDLLPLIGPLLTPGVGQVGITLPQTTGEAALDPGGGDAMSQPDAILVVDAPEVVEMVGRLIAEMDVPAPHVELEATIVDVRCAAALPRGVGQLLKAGVLDSSSGCVPLDDEEDCDLCCQTCPLTSHQLLERLRGHTELRIVSSARLHVLNKQPAELCIGDDYGWRLAKRRDGPASPAPGALAECARLWVRPYIAADELVRLEVAPQVSSVLAARDGSARKSFASAKTSVAIPNGGTLVIAGLNVQETIEPEKPWFKPWQRLAGRRAGGSESHREVVVMITPTIVRVVPPPSPSEVLSPPQP